MCWSDIHIKTPNWLQKTLQRDDLANSAVLLHRFTALCKEDQHGRVTLSVKNWSWKYDGLPQSIVGIYSTITLNMAQIYFSFSTVGWPILTTNHKISLGPKSVRLDLRFSLFITCFFPMCCPLGWETQCVFLAPLTNSSWGGKKQNLLFRLLRK